MWPEPMSIHKYLFHNDRVLPLGQIRLSPGQAGLLNGWGIFSTLRVYKGLPFAFDRHWERLQRDAERINLPLPHEREQVRRAALELLRANGVEDGCLRLYFVYNRIGIWCSQEKIPVTDLIMYTADLPMRAGAVKLGLLEHARYAAHPLAGVKVTSWLENVWAAEKAHNLGFEDMVLLNEHGQVAECTAANLFLVHSNKVSTPSLNSGCLAGVSRQILLEMAPSAGVAIKEREITVEEMHAADEVFISSTTREVQPVSHIEDHEYKLAPGPVTERLAQFFAAYVRSYSAKAPAR
jgi:branched-chain amino acid aminotransferase